MIFITDKTYTKRFLFGCAPKRKYIVIAFKRIGIKFYLGAHPNKTLYHLIFVLYQ